MKQDLTDITIVLDRSGSMSSVKSDTIGGFNTFLDGQRAVPGAANVSLAQFDHEYEVVYAGRPIADAPGLTPDSFVPRGNTALLDAIGRTINETGKRLASIPEEQRPGKVIFVIVTDGQENASHEFTRTMIHDQITHQRKEYSWEFVFIGANQDAIATATSMGVAAGSSLTYASNAVGTRAAFASLNANSANYRSGKSATMDFDDEDRKKQAAAGASS